MQQTNFDQQITSELRLAAIHGLLFEHLKVVRRLRLFPLHNNAFAKTGIFVGFRFSICLQHVCLAGTRFWPYHKDRVAMAAAKDTLT